MATPKTIYAIVSAITLGCLEYEALKPRIAQSIMRVRAKKEFIEICTMIHPSIQLIMFS
jgi:hypothetical protein